LKGYDQIQVQYTVEVRKILGNGELVTGVELYNHQTRQTSTFPTSGVFLAVGHDPNSQLAEGAVAMNLQGYITVEGRTQETSVSGIFAAGDVADFRYRQAGTSAGQGISAGLDAVRFLDDIGFTPEIAKLYAGQFFGADTITRGGPLQEAMIIPLSTMDELRAFTDQEECLVVDFWAETCPSCKLMLPVFKTVAQDFAGKVTFATVDTDEAPEITKELFVHKIPCLIIFKKGRLVARYTNVMSRNELAMLIQQVLEENKV
jgi:thioredoxin reductase (NADPH)